MTTDDLLDTIEEEHRPRKKRKESTINIWMPHYIREFLDDRAGLDLAQTGALIIFHTIYWSKGPLPNDSKILANIIGVNASKWKREFEPVLMPFFVLEEDGKLHHKRLDAELEHARGISKVRSTSATLRGKNKGSDAGDYPPDDLETGSNCTSNAASNATAIDGDLHDQMPTHARVALHLQSQRKKDSVATQQAPANAVALDLPEGVRRELWVDGLVLLRSLTGRPDGHSRAFLGKLVKEAGDDCAMVLAAIHEAVDRRPGNPEAWLSAACRPPPGHVLSNGHPGLSKRKAAMLKAGGLLLQDAGGDAQCL